MDGGAQRKFLDLGGSAENQGDLRSVVLHKMTLGAQKSTFPIALVVRTARQWTTRPSPDRRFASSSLNLTRPEPLLTQTVMTESYSMITMPNADSHTGRVLQEDNTELAYEALFFVSNHSHSPTTLTLTRACLRSSLASSR